VNNTRFSTEVEALWWDDDRRQWQVRNGRARGNHDTLWANVVIRPAG
jgi:hypothetical protein